MFWFHNKGEPVCMETNIMGNIRIQTVLDLGFFVYGKVRDFKGHRHLNHEIYFVEAGTAEIWCEEMVFSCNENELFLIPAGKEHHVQSLSEDGSIYSLRFSVSVLENTQYKSWDEIYTLFLKMLHERQSLKKEMLIRTMKEIRAELYTQNAFSLEKIQGLLQIFYVDLIRCITGIETTVQLPDHFTISFHGDSPHLMNRYRGDIPQEFYMDLLDEYFTHFYQRDPSLSQLAQKIHLSISQTQRLIKNYYGVSFREKLTQTRIDAAKQFMCNDTFSLEEIAEKVGYSSYNGFFESFIAQVGMPPSQYRQILLYK